MGAHRAIRRIRGIRMGRVFIGATMTRGLLLSMLGAMATFFITYMLLYPTMGNHALWLAFILYLSMRGVLQTIIYRRHRWE